MACSRSRSLSLHFYTCTASLSHFLSLSPQVHLCTNLTQLTVDITSQANTITMTSDKRFFRTMDNCSQQLLVCWPPACAVHCTSFRGTCPALPVSPSVQSTLRGLLWKLSLLLPTPHCVRSMHILFSGNTRSVIHTLIHSPNTSSLPKIHMDSSDTQMRIHLKSSMVGWAVTLQLNCLWCKWGD